MNFPVKQVTRRYAFIASLLVFAGICVLGKAIYIMTVEKEYWMEVNKRFVDDNRTVPPTRGNILAANGEVLAASLPEYKLYMDFMATGKKPERVKREQFLRDSLLDAKMDSICEGMHAIIPEIDPVKFKEHLKAGRKAKSRHWLLYPQRVTYIQYKQAKMLPVFSKTAYAGGFHIEEFKTRKNPYGRLAIRTIGDLYKGKDEARTGIELSCDSILRGKPGRAHRKKVLNRYLTIVDQPAEDGCDVMTTIDVNMQDVCEKALNDKLTEIEAMSGVCILMEVKTGDIKAMTSLRRLSNGTYEEINADAVKNLYEPGSVFKPMSFLVGMDDGYIHMTDVVDVGCGIKEMHGRKMRDANWRSGGSGVVTVPQILQKSLNVGVSTLIDRFYFENPRKFVEGIYRIGVAEDLKLPIPGYAKPRIRMPKEDGSNWSKTAIAWMSIGYETQIPPITTVNFYNGIANNGKLLRPRLIKAILRDGEVIKEFPVEVLREQMAKPEAVKNIQDCLESVVSVGLGKKARSQYFTASGKTGTAQIWTKNGFTSEYLISFAGYFPAENPLYSCIVCIHKRAPASGGGMCAPVFKRVSEVVMAQRRSNDYTIAKDTLHMLKPMVNAGNLRSTASVLDQLGIAYSAMPNLQTPTLRWGICQTTDEGLRLTPAVDVETSLMPDLKGYGLRDATYRLEKIGLAVTAEGVGYVEEQSIPAGTEIERGEQVLLTLKNPTDHSKRKKRTTIAPRPTVQPTQRKDSTHSEKNRSTNAKSKVTPKQQEQNQNKTGSTKAIQKDKRNV